MIQLNMLPDVKAKYINAQRKKRTVLFSALSISGAFLAVIVLMGIYLYVGQYAQLKLLEDDINKNSAKIQSIEGMDKILTVQNQLNSLTALHDQKPIVFRLFTYLPQITPTTVQISDLDLDFEEGTIQFTGDADALQDINKFVDTLKFTEYSIGDNTDKKQKAFSEVVLTSFAVNSGQSAGTGVSYGISLKFDPVIFSSDNQDVKLIVPKITSTRSQTEQPGALFNTQQDAQNQGGIQ